MNKTEFIAFVTRFTTSLKRLFATKAQTTTDIATAKGEAKTEAVAESKTYTDTKVADATNNSATNASVDTKIATLNATITAFQGGLDDKIDTKVASLGTFIGASNKVATLPNVDQNGKPITAGDFAHLTAKDGTKKKGLYRYDGANWVFISGDPAIVEVQDNLKATDLTDVTVDNKFVTPKFMSDYLTAQLPTQAEIDTAVDAG